MSKTHLSNQHIISDYHFQTPMKVLGTVKNHRSEFSLLSIAIPGFVFYETTFHCAG